MITNERQYRLTKSQAEKFQQAIENFDAVAKIASGADPRIVHAQLGALETQVFELLEAVKMYEEMRLSGNVPRTAEGLESLPVLLIKSRIATGLTQKALAERIGIKEQQIQRYEAERYGTASLARIIEVASALGVQLRMETRALANTNETAQQRQAPPINKIERRSTHGMKTGTVRFYNNQKGFGFIQPDDGGNDVFVHATALERAGLRSLQEGQKVSFDTQQDRRTGKVTVGNFETLRQDKGH